MFCAGVCSMGWLFGLWLWFVVMVVVVDWFRACSFACACACV